MKIPFTKMHGAANDFVMIDDRELAFPHGCREWLKAVAARRTGIGCEGVVLIQPANDADLRMRFFNPDGGEVEMCGNAARCTVRFAYERGLAPAQMRVQTVAGQLQAECLDDGRVRVQMTPPCDRRESIGVELDGRLLSCDFVNTGVPHAVVEAEALAATDVQADGGAIRRHAAFSPDGTNVDFVCVRPDGALQIRTYERGVEQETLACGTGMVAAAVVFAEAGRCTLPVDVHCASGDHLTIDGEMRDGVVATVSQTGPACVVYEGVLEVDNAVISAARDGAAGQA